MRNKRAKFLSFILTLVMLLRLLPGMSLTAYAETTTYKVEAKSGIEHGTLTLYMAEAEPGTAVPVLATPDNSYKLDTITATKEHTVEETLSVNSDQGTYFQISGSKFQNKKWSVGVDMSLTISSLVNENLSHYVWYKVIGDSDRY